MLRAFSSSHNEVSKSEEVRPSCYWVILLLTNNTYNRDIYYPIHFA